MTVTIIKELSNHILHGDENMTFQLPKLDYEYNALEPHIDEATMKLHHGKHHAGYTTKFNAALEKHPELFHKSAEELIAELDTIPEDIRSAVQNNGGGYLNHLWFWNMLTPESTEPKGDLLKAINESFGSLDEFKAAFERDAMGQFGSGWAWLVQGSDDKLSIVTTANQDNPITQGFNVLLGVDLWEHSYYVRYFNRRDTYLKAIWNIINWEYVASRMN